jgi:hypothetical protein
VGHTLAVEAANWRLRRTLAERIVSRLRGLTEAIVGFGEWISGEDSNLTQIFSGIGFRLQARPTIEVRVEFQSWRCRNAIFGLRSRDVDGCSEAAADMRRRLVAAGLSTGNNSPYWIWYRSLEPADWFDQPEIAVDGYEGRVAQRTANQLSELVQAVERAELLTIGQRTESGPEEQG